MGIVPLLMSNPLSITAKIRKILKKANWSICESVMNEEAKKHQQNGDNDDEKEDAAAQQLLYLYKQSPLKFRNTMMKMLGKHRQDIMKWGDKNEDGSNQITEDQMVQYLSIDNKMSPILAKVIFAMIYSAKSDIKKQIAKQKNAKKTISRVEVVSFAQGVKKKRHVRQVTAQDANWVLDKIQSTHFAEIEKNDENKINMDGFKKKFLPMGISDERIKQIFDEIDTSGTGKISVVQYRKWQSNKKANELLVTLNK